MADTSRGRGGVRSWHFGVTAEGRAVEAYELASGAASVRILTWGGIVAALHVPDRHGRSANVVLGRSTLEEYEGPHPYLGALVGRYANRIAGGRFELDGVAYQLPINDGPNHLHGGERGFDKQVWDAEEVDGDEGPALALRYRSRAGEQGYPGTVDVEAVYELSAGPTLRLAFRATTDHPTPVCLTNHSYFNLAGEGSGTVDGHLLELAAAHYTPVDSTAIPTGEIASVDGTPFDFRQPTPLGPRIRSSHPQVRRCRGIDHNFVLDGPRASGGLRRAARLVDPVSGRSLEIHTTEPGLQVYTGNYLDGSLDGAGGGLYRQGDGIALETQHFPDSPNRPEFPSPILRPGERYASTTEFRFGIVP